MNCLFTLNLLIVTIFMRDECFCNRLAISRNDLKLRQNLKATSQKLATAAINVDAKADRVDTNYENKIISSNGQELDTANIVRLRGFQAQFHHVSPSAWYNLSLVRIVNPLIQNNISFADEDFGNKRRYVPVEPILFIHGIFESSKSFLMNSMNVKPKNYATVNVRSLKEIGLRQLLKDDPCANSLPFLLSNFGFDVWLLSRRAALESQKLSQLRPHLNFNIFQALQKAINKQIQNTYNQLNPLAQLTNGQVGSSQNYFDNLRAQLYNNSSDQGDLDEQVRRFVYGQTANRVGMQSSDEYWNFALDEQAELDLPQVIDYILATSGQRRLSLVGHSLGAALPLMMLIKRPEYNSKINRQVLFAPALHLGDSFAKNPLVQLLASIEPILVSYLGPISPTFFVPLIQTLVAGPCQLGLLPHDKICRSVLDALFGFSSKQLNRLADNMDGANKLMDFSGSGEIVQLMQSMKRGKMHHFDYRNDRQNMLLYGSFSEPPVYNVSNISGKIRFSIWSGNKDPLVTQRDTQLLIDQLVKVEVEKNFVDWPGIQFNHVAFLLHKNLSTLVNIPTLLTLTKL